MEIVKKHCVPCTAATPALSETEEKIFIDEHLDWEIVRTGIHKLKKTFKFKTFNEAIDFLNEIAKESENEGHHPDIRILYNKVIIELYTHAIAGLSENDCIMAEQFDTIYLWQNKNLLPEW